jgi:serine protease
VIAVAAVSALPANDALSNEPSAARTKRTVAEEPLVGQLMVKLRNPQQSELVQPLAASRVASLSASAGIGLKAVRPMAGNATVLALPRTMRLSEASAVIARLSADPNVEWAAPDMHVRRAQTPPNTGYATRQWNLFAPTATFTSGSKMFMSTGGANLQPFWASTQGNSTVRVAIIDTGVSKTHPALQAAIEGGYDFTSSASGTSFGLPAGFLKNKPGIDARDPDASDPGDWVTAADKQNYAACRLPGESGPTYVPDDSSWHGTHMAGIVAAQWQNVNTPGTSVAGIAPNVRIVPIRALGRCGGVSSDIIDAIYWAAGLALPNMGAGINNGGAVMTNPNPANVINLSLGSSAGACNVAYQNAIDAAVARGVVITVATGNDSANTVSAPANCNNVIAVTAHVINGDNATYANVGPQTDISAPGGGAPQTLATNPAIADSDSAFYIWSPLLFGPQGPTSVYTGPAGTTCASGCSGAAVGGFTGTSPATPHVSAVAALLFSLSPKLQSAQVVNLIQTSARAHPAGGWCVANPGTCGPGLLDGGSALTLHNARRATVQAPAQTATAGAAVTLVTTITQGAAPGGNTFTYTWMQTGGPSVTLQSATTASPTFTAPVANGAITFSVFAEDNLGYRTASATKTVTVTGGADMPAITAQPQSATVNAGQTATFTVTATGTGPLAYQWSRNGTAINGATAASYTTPALGAADSGVNYTVTVSNVAGSATSTPATVTVNAAPPPPSGGGGGGGSLPLLPVALLAALSLASGLRRH